MKLKNLVIITDCYDIASYEVKGKILSFLGDFAKDIIIDIVPIENFSIINGQFSLRLLADVYPKGTFFYVVLNPLKTQPLRIIGKTKNKEFIFCGRNTGVFDWFIQDFGCSALYEVLNARYCAFGGKNIYPEVLAKVLKGEEPKTFLKCIDITNISEFNTEDGTNSTY